jgi:hypothetical protein
VAERVFRGNPVAPDARKADPRKGLEIMDTPNLYEEHDAIYALQHCCLFIRAWGRPEYQALKDAPNLQDERRAFEELIAKRQLTDYVDARQKDLMIAWPKMPNLWLDTLINAMTVERGEALSDEQFEQLGLRVDEMFRAMRRFEVVGDLRAKQAHLPSRPAAASMTNKVRLGPSDLAEKHGVSLRALRGRLDRWRYEHDAGYFEMANRKRNEPQFLYDESAVMPIIEALKGKTG